MNYLCPVCGYDELDLPPFDFTICPSCGTEFGNDDYDLSHAQLRARWIALGPAWWSQSETPPVGWNPMEQLKNIEANTTTDPSTFQLVNIPMHEFTLVDVDIIHLRKWDDDQIYPMFTVQAAA